MRAQALAVLALLLAPGVAQAAPAWYERGLDTLFAQLGDASADAIDETPAPIDHGDVWAWTGDNGKALDALALSDAKGSPRAEALASFLAAASEGPILFKRRFQPAPLALVQNDSAGFELSNHLITLRGAWADARVAAVVEYHDGRDKTMAAFGPGALRVGGSWIDLAPLLAGGEARLAPDASWGEIAFRYEGQGLLAEETWRLDGQPRVLHGLRVLQAPPGLDAARLVVASLDVHAGESSASYGQVALAGAPLAPLDGVEVAPAGSPWALLADPGRTDEFASGLLLRFGPSLLGSNATALRPDGRARGLADEYPLAAPGAVSEGAALLDGVLTERPEAYSAIARDLESPRLAGVDPALTYEIGETALGAADYARATGNATLLARAAEWLRGYAERDERGTQARSLAAAALASLRLADATGDTSWLAQAEGMGRLLERYQERAGGVRSDPEGRAFVDSTAMAIRAWGELAARDPSFAAPLARAVASLHAGPQGVSIPQDDGGPDETDQWTFKSGLLLQAAPFLPDDVRWAARERAWASTRDFASAEVRTSVFSAETNSETQAWALLGLLVDEQRGDLPGVPDAEGSWGLARPGDGSLLLSPPWPDARLWVDPGWASWAPREAGPLGTTSYRSDGGAIALWPARHEDLPAGLAALAFPGLDAPRPPAALLAGLPVGVAWAWQDGAWRAWVPGGPSELALVRPGDVVLAWLDAPAAREVPDLPAPAAAPGVTPPFLVWGALPQRAGAVEAFVAGQVVARTEADAQGAYSLKLDVPAGALVEVRSAGAAGDVIAQPGGAARLDLQAVAPEPVFPWLWGLALVVVLAAAGLVLVWRARQEDGDGSNAGPPT